VTGARYDGVADWYDETLATSPPGVGGRELVLRLLGRGPGRLLDSCCGGGSHMLAFAEAGWSPVGVDVSEDQLRLARTRGCEVVRADAAALPFADGSFDAAVSMWTHTDVDDFPAVLRELARVLRDGAPLVHLGAHPCFVGPHSRFVEGRGIPELHDGYGAVRRYSEAPGISPTGLRARVGAVHLPLGDLLQAFLDAGFRLERIEESGVGLLRDYPIALALRAVASR
jgi:SAM-dependent methyltransferase